MFWAEQFGFIDKGGLEKAETKNKKWIVQFRATFFVRQEREQNNSEIVGCWHQVTSCYFLEELKTEEILLTGQLKLDWEFDYCLSFWLLGRSDKQISFGLMMCNFSKNDSILVWSVWPSAGDLTKPVASYKYCLTCKNSDYVELLIIHKHHEQLYYKMSSVFSKISE